MATVQVRIGDRRVPYTLPDTWTVRQAAAAIASLSGYFMWWFADWRLFARDDNPQALLAPDEEHTMVDPDVQFQRVNGFAVTLGWVNQVEVWN